MKSDIYNIQGKKAGSVELPENIFGVAWNDSLMHQVVTTMQANARTPVAHAKMRGEVRGGGKKPWQQKGTGRARHGSTRSPIWRGGGVSHGPRNEKVYARTLPKKMRAKALFMALSRKMKDGELILVDSFVFDAEDMRKESAHGTFGRSNVVIAPQCALVAIPERTEATMKASAISAPWNATVSQTLIRRRPQYKSSSSRIGSPGNHRKARRKKSA